MCFIKRLNCETGNKMSFTGFPNTSTHAHPADFKESIRPRVIPDKLAYLNPQQAMSWGVYLTKPDFRMKFYYAFKSKCTPLL